MKICHLYIDNMSKTNLKFPLDASSANNIIMNPLARLHLNVTYEITKVKAKFSRKPAIVFVAAGTFRS